MKSFPIISEFCIVLTFIFSFVNCDFFKDDLQEKCEASVAQENLQMCKLLAMQEERIGNYEKARKWYKYSCDREAADSCLYWGKMEAKLGNTEEAVRIYKTPCYRGNWSECTDLAILESKRTDKKQAIEKYNKDCTNGQHYGCFLARMLGENIADEGGMFILNFQMQCEDGDMKACSYAEKALERKGKKDQAALVYKIACEKGNKEACKRSIKQK